MRVARESARSRKDAARVSHVGASDSAPIGLCDTLLAIRRFPHPLSFP